MFKYETKEVNDRIIKITENNVNIIPDKVYKRSNGLYWYKSHKGYYHIVKCRKLSCGGNFIHYELVNKMLKPDNTFYEISSYGSFKSKEEYHNYMINEYKIIE